MRISDWSSDVCSSDLQSGEEPSAIPFLKCFTVFNVVQCEGLREGLAGDPAPLPIPQIIPHAEALIQATGADFRIGGSDAFYAPSDDYVQVPPLAAFRDANDFYDTAFHELSHWSGGKTRLARDMGGGYGSSQYAREELIAEISAAFIGATLGLVPTVRHADYLGFRSEEHTSELQSLMRISYAVFCLKKKKIKTLNIIIIIAHTK